MNLTLMRDLSRLAANAYDDGLSIVGKIVGQVGVDALSPGWRYVQEGELGPTVVGRFQNGYFNGENGADGYVAYNEVTRNVVIVFRGTEIDDAGDIESDRQIAVGEIPDQYNSFRPLVDALLYFQSTHPSSVAYTAGHSLGGALAELYWSNNRSLFAGGLGSESPGQTTFANSTQSPAFVHVTRFQDEIGMFNFANHVGVSFVIDDLQFEPSATPGGLVHNHNLTADQVNLFHTEPATQSLGVLVDLSVLIVRSDVGYDLDVADLTPYTAVIGGSLADTLNGTGVVHDQRIAGRGGDDLLSGSLGNDTLSGGPGSDGLSGRSGNDVLVGGDHDDRLDGSTGDDSVVGGGGSDIYNIGPNQGVDVLADQGDGVSDTITYYGSGLVTAAMQFRYALGPSPMDMVVTVTGTGGTILSQFTIANMGAAAGQIEFLHLVHSDPATLIVPAIDLRTEWARLDAPTPPSTSAVFSDNFNRPDGAVGNGWFDLSGSGQSFLLSNGRLTLPPVSVAGIARPVNYVDGLGASVTITQSSGFYPDYLAAYGAELRFANNGSVGSGYGIIVARSDDHYNNSRVILVLGDAQLETANSSFQFGAQVDVAFQVASNGSVSGVVRGDGQSFSFNFGPRSVDLSTGSFAIITGGSSTGTIATFDNLRLGTDLLAGGGDDYGGNTSTGGALTIGGSVQGSIETPLDKDWFAVSLVAGRTYLFDLRGIDGGGGTLADPFMRVRDASGLTLVFNEDAAPGTRDARIEFTAPSSGTYFVSVGGDLVTGGGYTLTAQDGLESGLNLIGDSNSNVIFGGQGNDTANGADGNDTLSGGAGDDLLIGGTGNDSILDGAGVDWILAGSGHDTVTVDAGGQEVVSGDDGNDVIRSGGSTDNTIFGGSGDDTITTVGSGPTGGYFYGGAGNDLIVGTGGFAYAVYSDALGPVTVDLNLLTPQVVGGGMGVDTLRDVHVEGSPFGDTLTGNAGANRLHGGAGGADLLSGLDGNDILSASGSFAGASESNTLLGGRGDDFLSASPGGDRLDGGTGFDTASLIFGATGPGVTVDLAQSGAPQQTGGDIGSVTLIGVEGLLGSYGADTLSGDESANALDGFVGDDRLVGRGGSDTLTDAIGHNTLLGGSGDDVLDAGDGNDVLDGGAGVDRVQFTYGGPVTVNLATAGSQATGGAGFDTFLGIENLRGSSYDDSLTGDAANNRLDGYFGNDTVSGGDGHDIVEGGAGDDRLNGDNGNDFVVGASGNDTVGGGDGNDVLQGNADNDSLNGGAGADFLLGGLGDDVIDGGADTDSAQYFDATAGVRVNLAAAGAQNTGAAGLDTLLGIENLSGSAFDDSLVGHAGNNQLDGQNGNDTLVGADGNDNLFGGDGADSANGGNQNDFLSGGTGDDTLAGGDGADNVQGGGDNDSLNGGSENDFANGGAGDDTLTGDSGADNLTGDIGDDHLSGGADNDVADGSAGDDTVAGDDGSDSLQGGEGNDSASGGAGNDTILGGAHNDTLTGGDGVDDLKGEAGSDSLSAGSGNDVVYGGDDSDSLGGGDGNDFVFGGADDDSLSGDAGDDFLTGGSGDDLIDGGAGGDHAQYSDATAAVTVSLAIVGAQATGGAGIDTLIGIENLGGGAFDDRLTGDGGANFLSGQNGADTLAGGDGIDILLGGADGDSLNGGSQRDLLFGDAGHDTLIGDAGADQLSGGAGDDLIDGGADADLADYLGAASGVAVSLALLGAQNTGSAGLDTLIGIEGLSGSQFDDTLSGDAAANTFFGQSGNDSLVGGDGDDFFRGGGGNDTLSGGNGFDTVDYQGTLAVRIDLAIGGVQDLGVFGFDQFIGIEVVLGSNQSDTLAGDALANTLQGGEGADSISGRGGLDTMLLGGGNDTGNGGDGDDCVLGGDGDDSIDGGVGHDSLAGDDGNDTIVAGAGNDSIVGAIGNDSASAGDGNDTLQGGSGDDVLAGARGTDVFVFGAGFGHDTVVDFRRGEDNIHLLGAGFTSFSDMMARALQVGSHVVITNDAGDSLQLNNVSLSSLQAGDFLFG